MSRADAPGLPDESRDLAVEDENRDLAEEAYWRAFCGACGASPCTWDGTPDGFHTDDQPADPE